MIAGLSDCLRRVMRGFQPATGAARRRDGIYAEVSGHTEGAICGTPPVGCRCPLRPVLSPGSKANFATHGRECDQAWNCETSAGRRDSNYRVSFQRHANAHGVQRRSRPAADWEKTRSGIGMSTCAHASKPLRKRIRTEHEESRAQWRGSIRFCSLRSHSDRKE